MRSFSGWLWSGRISGRLIITNGHKCRQDKTVYTTQQVSEDVLILAACPVTVMRLTTCLLSSPGEWERPSGADPVYDLLMSWNGSQSQQTSHCSGQLSQWNILSCYWVTSFCLSNKYKWCKYWDKLYYNFEHWMIVCK